MAAGSSGATAGKGVLAASLRLKAPEPTAPRVDARAPVRAPARLQDAGATHDARAAQAHDRAPQGGAPREANETRGATGVRQAQAARPAQRTARTAGEARNAREPGTRTSAFARALEQAKSPAGAPDAAGHDGNEALVQAVVDEVAPASEDDPAGGTDGKDDALADASATVASMLGWLQPVAQAQARQGDGGKGQGGEATTDEGNDGGDAPVGALAGATRAGGTAGATGAGGAVAAGVAAQAPGFRPQVITPRTAGDADAAQAASDAARAEAAANAGGGASGAGSAGASDAAAGAAGASALTQSGDAGAESPWARGARAELRAGEDLRFDDNDKGAPAVGRQPGAGAGAGAGASASASGGAAGDARPADAFARTLQAASAQLATLAAGAGNGRGTGDETTGVASGTAPAAADAAGTTAGAAAAQAAGGQGALGRTAQAAPAERTVPAPMGDRHWARALSAQVMVLASHKVGEATLRLNPEHTGPVEVKLQVQDAAVNVTFNAAQADTRTALEQALPQLRAAFAGAGLALGQATVGQQMRQGSQFQPTAAKAGDPGADAVVEAAPAVVRRVGLLDEYA